MAKIKQEPRTLAQLHPNPRNPRKITDFQLQALKASLLKFGDLSGFVENARTGNLVGAHQRMKVMPPEAPITIEKEYAEPTKAGTLAEGFVEWEGERFTYRKVDWDQVTENAAMIAANQHGGEFDSDQVASILAELNGNIDTALTGFDSDQVAEMLGMFDVSGVASPELQSGGKTPFRTVSFTLHDEQYEEVEAAMKKAKGDGHGESAVNENSNGNAIAWICRSFNNG